VPNFVTNGSRIELEVSNEKLAWDNKSGLQNSLTWPYLYALNGQPDDEGPVNSEIYAGFNRVISGPFDRIGSGASKVTILLNPLDYAISADTATVTEGNSGETAIAFTVTRSGCTELESQVDYEIAGTADDTDYNNIGGTSGANGATGTINFAAGETSKTITLDILGDVAIEPDETVNVTLSNPSGLDSTPTITTATATTTITNDDILTGDSGNDFLRGMRGNASLENGIGNDSVFGSQGSETLLGSSGDDALFGGKGDDFLNGGLGMDTMTGGMGADKFLLSTNSGTDTITNFEVGKDLLVLANGLNFSQLAIAQDSGATLILFANTGEILASLGGVSASSISPVNFGLI
jgi:Ca2+-binding RTX toxin-like protein